YRSFVQGINNGAVGSITAIINTSAAVGFGSVVKAVPGFETLTNLLLNIKGNPLISEAIAVNLLAGATGSASGGMGIALEALGEKYFELATQTGISPEAFHRIASIASGGLDTLPHNGAVLTLLTITGMSHKDSYRDIFVVSLLIPLIALAVAIILAALGIY
ncbi:MAG: GntP family permease, partial [Caldibacillus sp.]